MVLVVDVENLCQSFILAAIKEYSLFATASVVKLVVIILPEFLTSFAAFSADLASIEIQLLQLGEGRSRSCQKLIYFCRIVTMDIWHISNILSHKNFKIIFFTPP